MRTEELTDDQCLTKMVSGWEELCRNDDFATPFQFPQWQIPWWSHFGGSNFRAVAVYDNDNLAGLALFYIYRQEKGVRKLCFVGSGISDYLDIISLPSHREYVTKTVLEYLRDIKSQWDECDLQDIRAGARILNGPYPQDLIISVEKWNVCPFLELPRMSENIRSVIPKKLRKNLKHATKELSIEGTMELRIANQESLNEYIKELVRLHNARWNSRQQPGVIGNADLQTFYKETCNLLQSRNLLRLYLLFLNDKAIASYLVMNKDSTSYAYIGGFDPDMVAYSPGSLALLMIIEDSINKGCKIFDFLRGAEDYKYLWRPKDHINYRLRLY
jgi:CelD/BcsL family acetyltransferase involved in cellulose biosynthesis